MNIMIDKAAMRRDAQTGYIGNVKFRVVGHPAAYEITLFSKEGRDWEYGLHFADTPGSEEHIIAVEEYLEEHDDAFERLVNAALEALER